MSSVNKCLFQMSKVRQEINSITDLGQTIQFLVANDSIECIFFTEKVQRPDNREIASCRITFRIIYRRYLKGIYCDKLKS